MRRLVSFSVIAAAILALPFISAPSEQSGTKKKPTLDLQVSHCKISEQTFPADKPKVSADRVETASLLCSIDDFSNQIEVIKFSFDNQTGDTEAVSSSNFFVPTEHLNRFGFDRIDFEWGSVNAFKTLATTGEEVTVLQWYELDGDVFSMPSDVKIREFVSALFFQKLSPSIYVVRWLPNNQGSEGQTVSKISFIFSHLVKDA